MELLLDLFDENICLHNYSMHNRFEKPLNPKPRRLFTKSGRVAFFMPPSAPQIS